MITGWQGGDHRLRRAGCASSGITLTDDEAEAEQDAAQTRVRKGPAQPTEEQIMKHNATHSSLPRLVRALHRGESARLATLANCQFFHSGSNVSAGLFLS